MITSAIIEPPLHYYVNRMGAVHFQNINNLSRLILSWYEERDICIYASYISSGENTEVDRESRRLDKVLTNIGNCLDKSEIDLFTNRTNTKCKRNLCLMV